MGQRRHLGGLALAALLCCAPAPAVAQDTPKDSDPPASTLRWRNRPSIQLGEHVRLDLRLKLARDWRRFDPDIDEDEDIWRLRRAGVEGELGEHFQFEIERDLHRDGQWRDIYLNWRTFRQLEITAGRFKVPFGREMNVGVTAIDFAARTLASNVIAPARDRGVMAHGRFLQRGFTYEFGVFDDDGDNGRLLEEQFSVTGPVRDIGPSYAGRITATPLRPLAETFERLRVGFAYGGTSLPEGLNSLRGPTVYGTAEFFEPVYVNGRRTRMGVQLEYLPGPVGITSEWMQAREQRKGQGLGDVDLSDLVITGWYLAGTWLLTGEDKDEFDNPRRPLFDGGIGAVELAARVEKLQFESAEKVGPAFRNPRAEHILGNSNLVWTFGVNWFPVRWVRVTANAVREELEDPDRSPLPGTREFWSALGRLQLVF
jgi:phosphate-selective porin OprO and OprP